MVIAAGTEIKPDSRSCAGAHLVTHETGHLFRGFSLTVRDRGRDRDRFWLYVNCRSRSRRSQGPGLFSEQSLMRLGAPNDA